MPNGGPHDPIRIRDNRRFLVIVAVLLGLVVVSVLWLSISDGTLGRPATWITLAVPLVLLVFAVRARLRTWPPETGRVDEFTSWAGLQPTRHEVSGSFGDRVQEYARPTLTLRIVRDQGQWSVDVSDREGRPDEWYDAALVRDLLDGGGNDVLTFSEQVAVVERGWKEIAGRFFADRRDESHARLAVLRKQRARRRILDPISVASAEADRQVTPGWKFLYIGVEGDVPAMGGIDPWKHKWRSLPSVKIVVPHTSYPTQRHDFRVYEFDGPSGPVQFAAGEYSNGVWGIFVPESNRSAETPLPLHDDAFRAVVRRWFAALAEHRDADACAMLHHPNSHGITWTASAIRKVIADYGARDVTPPDTATGEPHSSLVALADGSGWSFAHDVPLDGAWSDLTAQFKFLRRGDEFAVVLHDLHVL